MGRAFLAALLVLSTGSVTSEADAAKFRDKVAKRLYRLSQKVPLPLTRLVPTGMRNRLFAGGRRHALERLLSGKPGDKITSFATPVRDKQGKRKQTAAGGALYVTTDGHQVVSIQGRKLVPLGKWTQNAWAKWTTGASHQAKKYGVTLGDGMDARLPQAGSALRRHWQWAGKGAYVTKDGRLAFVQAHQTVSGDYVPGIVMPADQLGNFMKRRNSPKSRYVDVHWQTVQSAMDSNPRVRAERVARQAAALNAGIQKGMEAHYATD